LVEERRRQAGTLLSALRHDRSASAETAKLLCGDFNDVADSPAIRAILGSDEGFHDAFAEQSPNSPGFTYSPKNPYVDRSWTVDQRIDFIFINDKLVIKTCSVVFDGQGGLDLVSDHFGVFSELDFRSKT
jgi:endonuclease/exonuclease/phosphatase family metal-dependent hydrolase